MAGETMSAGNSAAGGAASATRALSGARNVDNDTQTAMVID